jgi:hypothetical protein
MMLGTRTNKSETDALLQRIATTFDANRQVVIHDLLKQVTADPNAIIPMSSPFLHGALAGLMNDLNGPSPRYAGNLKNISVISTNEIRKRN